MQGVSAGLADHLTGKSGHLPWEECTVLTGTGSFRHHSGGQVAGKHFCPPSWDLI